MADKQQNHVPFAWLVVVFTLGSLALSACGGDEDTAETGDTVEPAGGDDGSDAPGTAWTDIDFERLVTIEVDGYSIESARVSEFGNATVQHLESAPAGPVALSALVTFQPCDPFVCSDLSAEIDEQRRENIRSLLPRLHIDNPDLVEEIGPIELAGRTVLAIYFRSFVDQDDGQATALSYRAITHDGTNLITVQVSPDFMSAGGLAASAEELEERMDVDAGAAVAADVLTALSSELG